MAGKPTWNNDEKTLSNAAINFIFTVLSKQNLSSPTISTLTGQLS
jgi:hypothetical protein